MGEAKITREIRYERLLQLSRERHKSNIEKKQVKIVSPINKTINWEKLSNFVKNKK
jgi:hypothetical protein